MKKILITGANSYVGTSFEEYINKNYFDQYEVDTLDMIDGSWKDHTFAGYYAVFHVAGIAHQKETKNNTYLYYEVNRDLAIATAQKARSDGVKQFLFMSSMSVYGLETGVITKETIPNPKSNYGRSKLQAESEIKKLADKDFIISILRPPMIYGKGCKGNFQSVVKLVRYFPFFPNIDNQRSMIFIDNLSEAVVQVIKKETSGIILPQNREKMNTTYLAVQIGKCIGKRIHKSKLLGHIVRLLMPFSRYAKKAFGTLIYDTDSEQNDFVQLEESIRRSIG